MADALSFLQALKTSLWAGLDSIQFPVLGVSMLVVFIAVLFINLTFWFLSVLTGGRQNGNTNQKLDDNNNYIYRR